MTKPTADINKALAFMLMHKESVFHASVLCACTFDATDEYATLATNGVDKIVYNPEYLSTITQAELIFVLMHEAEHIIGLHQFRKEEYQRQHPSHDLDHKLMVLAADLSINNRLNDWLRTTYIKDKVKMPDEAMTRAPFAVTEHIDYHSTAIEKIYEYLYQEIEENPALAEGAGGEAPQGEGENQPKPSEKVSALTSDDNPINGNDMPEELQSPEPKDQNQIDADMHRAKAIVKAAEKQAGEVPAYLKVDVTESIAPPKVNWKRILRQFALTTARSNWSYSKFNRNYITNDPLVILPGRHSKDVSGLHIYLDVSGSVVYAANFDEVLSETVAVAKQSTDVTMGGFDTQVTFKVKAQQTQYAKTEMLLKEHAKGGGGTVISAPITEQAESKLPNPRAMIIVTDGYGPCKVSKPPYPVLFVLVGDGTTTRFLPEWGRVVEVN